MMPLVLICNCPTGSGSSIILTSQHFLMTCQAILSFFVPAEWEYQSQCLGKCPSRAMTSGLHSDTVSISLSNFLTGFGASFFLIASACAFALPVTTTYHRS